MEILVVGGAVRDLLLGRPAADKDFLVTGTDEAGFLRAFPEARKVGKSFPVFWLDGKEYAFPRGASLETDLAARDFTINAMALGDDGRLLAHPLALEDLRNRVLRPASAKSLSDDPLRAYRAARFLSCLPDFSPHPSLVSAMAGLGEAPLATLNAERVGNETRKAMAGARPGRFLRFLHETGCLRPWFAELAPADRIPAGPPPHHAADLLAHTVEVMDRTAGDMLASWMALCHDLGKCATPPGSWPAHHGHDAKGAALAESLGRRLRLPAGWIRAGADAARLHMKAARYPSLRPGTRVDLLMALHRGGIMGQMFALVRADHGQDHLLSAGEDMKRILAVRLDKDERDLGPDSGARLRMKRAEALLRRGPDEG